MTKEVGETESLFLTESEIASALGIGVKTWRASAAVLEKEGLPHGDPLFAGRRYMPAVRAFLDRRAGLRAESPYRRPDGKENFDE